MLLNKKIISALVAAGMFVQSSYVGFAISSESKVFNRVVSSYQKMASELRDLIEKHDEPDEYIGEIELRIGESKMVVDGNSEKIDDQGTTADIIDNSTMIPARALAETLGCSVEWNGREKKVEIRSEEVNIDIPIDVSVIEVNGEEREIPAAARIINNRTLVPARALCEGLGCEVDWDGSTETVTITRDFQTKRLIVKLRNDIDFGRFGAEAVINAPGNEYTIVQFATIDDTKKAYNELQANGSVEYVEPDLVLRDAELSGNDNQDYSDSWDLNYTQILPFANSINAGKKVKIAVIDSGVKPVGVLRGKVENGSSRVKGRATDPKLEHGTSVAGIIAKCMGKVNYSIYPYMVTNSENFDICTSEFALAIDTCVEADADVINISINTQRKTDDHIRNSINNALSKKTAVVVSAGNLGYKSVQDDWLASLNEVIVVGGVDQTGKRFSTPTVESSYGNTVDVMAPGVDIKTLGLNGEEISREGTSFAAPQVSAAAALIKAKNPSFAVADIEREIKRNVFVPQNWNSSENGAGILCFGTPGQQPEVPNTINASNITIKKGTTGNIAVKDGTGNPVNAASCTFQSDNTGVAQVSNDGVVTGVAAGSANVTIKYGELQTKITVTVTEEEVEKEIVAYEWDEGISGTLQLQQGESRKLKVYEVYNDGSKAEATSRVVLKSNKPQVASISADGNLTAVSAGKATIIMDSSVLSSVKNLKPLSVNVTEIPPEPQPGDTNNQNENNSVIEQPQLERFEWSTDTATKLEVGETTNIKLYAVYSDGNKKDVTKTSNLYSTDTNVVKIDSNGKITAVGFGNAKIMQGSASLSSISTARPFSITVKEPTVELEGFEWSKSSLPDLEVGGTANIKLYAIYSNGDKNDVTQSSGLYSTDENVVKIDSNGKITAVGGGTAKIMQGSAALSGIRTARPISITVNEPVVEPEENVDFKYESNGSGVEITGYTGSDRYVTIPETINGKDVVSIGSRAFYGNKNISSVSMPSTVEEIGDYAFANCRSLKNIHFSRAITEIGSHAFDDCRALTGVNLPSRLDEISPYMFRGCTALKRITIPSGVSEIGESAFANCRSLDITIPDSVEEIASSAFTSGNSIRISGKAGSVAESYALEKGFEFN